MAVVCDRCLGKNASKIRVVFRKFDGTNRLGREMITSDCELCEQCTTEYLKAFGSFRNKFLKEGDQPEKGAD